MGFSKNAIIMAFQYFSVKKLFLIAEAEVTRPNQNWCLFSFPARNLWGCTIFTPRSKMKFLMLFGSLLYAVAHVHS